MADVTPERMAELRRPSLEDRFWSRVETTPDCWHWIGFRNQDGYGRFSVEHRRTVQAHRFAYELLVGPIADGLELDHLCRIRHCVNPEHLEPVTRRVNQLRGQSPTAINARKTHCLRGHELTGDNVKLIRGRRHCKACQRIHQATYRARRRAAAVIEAIRADGGDQ